MPPFRLQSARAPPPTRAESLSAPAQIPVGNVLMSQAQVQTASPSPLTLGSNTPTTPLASSSRTDAFAPSPIMPTATRLAALGRFIFPEAARRTWLITASTTYCRVISAIVRLRDLGGSIHMGRGFWKDEARILDGCAKTC
ncbi:uncharacterized protein BDZ99DRAFT_576761 [Mytilinidion resinicola]|uniref:Uncharacterized protein n=1 Tax=Mytilinidion resinicola TaxID=574789 RepID=A0A6A6Y141_9PEZI|nr:uncharacterized protein BDZ99DRAFT_576761 [Mytilinidion resinicola]KAF2802359.1 hypothetical protein BDZ99DRAFT_576761 [Mytilinidion resinicola]